MIHGWEVSGLISPEAVTSLPPAEPMKLRFPSRIQQLLFTTGCAIMLGCAAMAQQDADVFIGGQPKRMKVVGVSGSSLMVKTEFGEQGLPLKDIQEVRMAAPPEFAQAFQAYQSKEYTKALPLFKMVADKFRGMPTAWAQQASGMLVEIDLAMNEAAKADADYAAFVKAYPAGGTAQADVLAARIAVAKKNFAVAKQKLAPLTETALKEKTVSPANALAFSQAFLVSGEVKESEGNFAGALEDYLRTVTLFYHDRAAVGVAQERADSLRGKHPEITVP
jgi:hypothetical protein